MRFPNTIAVVALFCSCGSAIAVPVEILTQKPAVDRLLVPHNATIRFQLASRNRIKEFSVQSKGVVSVIRLPGDDRTLLLTGIAAERTRFEVKDEDGKAESHEVIVFRELVLFLEDEPELLQARSGKPVRMVQAEAADLLRLETVASAPHTVKAVGKQPGDTLVTVVDEAGCQDIWRFYVRSTKKLPENAILMVEGEKVLHGMRSNAFLREIVNENGTILRVSNGDGRKVLLTALSSGRSSVTMTDADGNVEVYEVLIRRKPNEKK